MNISIIGSLIFDKLYIHKEKIKINESNQFLNYIENVGAIGNVAKVLKRINTKITIKIFGNLGDDNEGLLVKKILKLNNLKINNIKALKNCNTSNALILANKTSSTTTSLVKWGACTKIKLSLNNVSKWNHFMYLDKLTNINYRNLDIFKNSINSADLVSSALTYNNKRRVLKCLKLIDFLILSEIEAKSLKKDTLSNTCNFIASKTRQFCIIHTTKNYYISNGTNIAIVKNKLILKNIIVLGAGDTFAAVFISVASKLNKNTFEFDEVKKLVSITSKITGNILKDNYFEKRY